VFIFENVIEAASLASTVVSINSKLASINVGLPASILV
jgi:hypothetical protein